MTAQRIEEISQVAGMPCEECDVLAIGSGVGGLATAVTAATLGLRVQVVEKDSCYGGTTAWSGGWMWVPRNPLAVAAGIKEPLSEPVNYLKHELGTRYDEERVAAFLEHGPKMIDFFREKTAVKFIDGNLVPDFHGNTPSAVRGGRSVCAAPFDGRELGEDIRHLRRPLDLISLWGMGIAAGVDMRHFMNSMRSLSSFVYVTKRVLRHWRDLLMHGRGMHLVNGNALVGRLAKSALDRGVKINVSTPAVALVRDGERIVGAIVDKQGVRTFIRATRGVVIAAGGFPHDKERMAQMWPFPEHWSAAPFSNTGDGLRLGESAGGTVCEDVASPVAWAPVSLVRRRDGTVGHYPHLIERGKPGIIGVREDGKRFTNEANSYYDVIADLFKATPEGKKPKAWLICDSRFIRRYSLGAAKPAPVPLFGKLRSGYLKKGATIAELARHCGVDAAGLEDTVREFNAYAKEGRDPLFHRGETRYNEVQGNLDHKPNPCLAPIEHGPFYAVEIVPGSLGTFSGLRTNAAAQVLAEDGNVIAGLYAGGNDMNSIMEGNYPSGGITLGPSMTFGYIAGHHLAGVSLPQ